MDQKYYRESHPGTGKESFATRRGACGHIYLFSEHRRQGACVPFISLDAMFWQPGWAKSTKDEMRERVVKALPRTVGSLRETRVYIRWETTPVESVALLKMPQPT